MQLSFCSIFSSSRGVAKLITRRSYQTVALGCYLTDVQVAIYKFIAMHKKYHTDFVRDKGGISVEGLKAVTEKPFLQLVHRPIVDDPDNPSDLQDGARKIAFAFDKFVLWSAVLFASRSVLGTAPVWCPSSWSMITSRRAKARIWMTKSQAKQRVTQ